MYCMGNSVFKCLSQILKEIFVIEETCRMQTLVYCLQDALIFVMCHSS